MPRSTALHVLYSGILKVWYSWLPSFKHNGDCPMICYSCKVNLDAIAFSNAMLDLDLLLMNEIIRYHLGFVFESSNGGYLLDLDGDWLDHDWNWRSELEFFFCLRSANHGFIEIGIYLHCRKERIIRLSEIFSRFWFIGWNTTFLLLFLLNSTFVIILYLSVIYSDAENNFTILRRHT